jgi:subtilisin family serine protease
LRNLITVGAVDQAGDATAFTRYDDAVAVYANGVHVRSMIPGGYTAALSGASIAAAQVTNLAAKLFALDPSLTSAQARALIVDGATPTPTGTLPLIDPKHSLILLQRLRTEHRSPA